VIIVVGFSTSSYDLTLVIHVLPRGMTLHILYVDDMIIIGDDPEYIVFVMIHLND
jgi:hypothetical protein